MKTKEYYITKYALTQGIIKVNAEANEQYPEMISIHNSGSLMQHFHGNDWHETYEEALDRAEEMKTQKLLSLTKQIERIKKIKFSRP